MTQIMREVMLGLISDYGALCLRVLRRFDAHSNDPSLTRSTIREWERQTSYLFRECNIFRAPLAPSQGEGAGPGPREGASMSSKTATQIAMEQISRYIGEHDYATRIRDFQAAPPTQLFAAGVERMNQVVAAAQARVAADFTDAKDLYMCLEIFNLVVWLPLLPLATSQSLRNLEGAPIRLA